MAADTSARLSDPLARLREPFPPTQVGQLPKGGTTLDYVGHGAVTARLLDVDPAWNWEPVSTDADGLPLFVVDQKGQPIGLWIKLTVCNVTRLGFGNCRPGQFDAEKVLIGDALRNAAMRFGVALDLWTRGQAEDDEKHAASDTREAPARGRAGAPRACVICSKPLGDGAVARHGDGYAHKDCARQAAAS